jgi:phospholipid/cholesterol/gamma-HCH transport system ATP-binding protein
MARLLTRKLLTKSRRHSGRLLCTRYIADLDHAPRFVGGRSKMKTTGDKTALRDDVRGLTERRGVGLQVRGLRKGYNGHEVLKGIDFEVNPGEIFVLMGPSGCGKTVLLRQLIGLETPDQGEILVEGQLVQPPEITTHYRVAMVFQSGALLTSLTVGQNVGFYLAEHHLKSPGEIAEIVSKDLESVGLKGAENEMPGELSGGMTKRVSIARALAVEPQLIFYDEPTSGLDPVSSVEIAKDIVRLNERTHATSVVVSHDRDLAFGIADRIAVLEDGRIMAIGTPSEIKRNSNPAVQYFLNASIAQMRTPLAHSQTQSTTPELNFKQPSDD